MAEFTVNTTRFDPYKNFKFRVKWDGQYVAGISKVGGLKRTTEVVKHREGGDPSSTRKSPGRTEFDAITQNASCAQTADTATKNNCLLRGIPGNYNRFSAQMDWRREITDSLGQVFTPFAQLRADVATMHIDNDPGVSNFINTGDTNLVRAMPTVGLGYRYPFISVQSWGTQTIEPVAQVILRPNEAQTNALPNEDAQSLIFDDSNLFKVDKFSGWDRVEGGGREGVQPE